MPFGKLILDRRHSFGTYLVARAVEKYELEFDREIFCGTIVRRAYPWSQMMDHGLVRRVLNDFGRLDVWARVVEWVVSDAGQSGLRGFDDLANGRVVQREHPEFGHSDYFYSKNFRERWIPFLRGEDPRERPRVPKPRPTWRVRITAAALLVALIAAAAIGRHLYTNRDHDAQGPNHVSPPDVRPSGPTSKPGPTPIPDKQAQSNLAELAGDVRDETTGRLLEGVELVLLNYDDAHGKTPKCRTDEEGRFRFRDLPASPQPLQRVRLIARKEGYESSDTYTSLGQNALPVTLKPATAPEHLP